MDICRRFLATRNLQILPTRRAGTNENGVEILFEHGSHALDLGIILYIHAHIDDHRDLFIEHTSRCKTERRDVFERMSPPGLSIASKMVTS